MAKMCAWRDKDVDWLCEAFNSRIACVERVMVLLSHLATRST